MGIYKVQFYRDWGKKGPSPSPSEIRVAVELAEKSHNRLDASSKTSSSTVSTECSQSPARHFNREPGPVREIKILNSQPSTNHLEKQSAFDSEKAKPFSTAKIFHPIKELTAKDIQRIKANKPQNFNA